MSKDFKDVLNQLSKNKNLLEILKIKKDILNVVKKDK